MRVRIANPDIAWPAAAIGVWVFGARSSNMRRGGRRAYSSTLADSNPLSVSA